MRGLAGHPSQGLYGQLRVGRVSSVDKGRHTAQVAFFIEGATDEDSVSWDLQVLAQRRGDYCLPEPQSLVLCALIEGYSGVGYVLGVIYAEESDDNAPLDDAGQRSIAGDDIRLGDPAADDAVALAPPIKEHFDDQKTHFDAVWNVITGAQINEPGNGAPSALQIALKAAILGSPYPQVAHEIAAEKVSAK